MRWGVRISGEHQKKAEINPGRSKLGCITFNAGQRPTAIIHEFKHFEEFIILLFSFHSAERHIRIVRGRDTAYVCVRACVFDQCVCGVSVLLDCERV